MQVVTALSKVISTAASHLVAYKPQPNMSTLSAERKPPLDYGVQIRFIKDLHDTGGGYPATPTASPSSKYGVAVRVQGIAGQPYVVLKEGEKGDSYGVQLKSQPQPQPQGSSSLPRRKEDGVPRTSYGPVGDPTAPTLGRTQSQDSLLEKKAKADIGGALVRPPGDGRSGSCGTLDGGEKDRIENGREEERKIEGPVGLKGEESFPEPPPPVTCLDDDPSPAVDTNSLAPINRLISKFGGGDSPVTPTRGRSRLRTRVKPEEPKKSSSLDAPDDISQSSSPPPRLPSFSPSPSPSPITNPYSSSPPPSSTSSSSSLGRSFGSASKAMARPPAPTTPSSWSVGRVVAKETPSVTQTEKQVTPDLLKDQGKSSEVTSKDERTKQAIYNILKEGTNESVSATKRKVDLVFEKIQDLGVSQPDHALKVELEECLEENLRLQEQLDRKSDDLNQAHSELTQSRMEREQAERRGRLLEDQLAQQQEDLRRAAEDTDQAETLHTDLASAQAELSESALLQQRLEETLRQRERELTALKGALKDEVATHDQEIEALREQYAQDMERLRNSMEQVSQSQQGIESERLRVNASMRSLQQQLEGCREEGGRWKQQLDTAKEELSSTKEELLQARQEKEDKNIPARSDPPPSQDLQQCQASLMQARSELEKLKVELDKKGAELVSLKKASQEREAEQGREIDRLKAQSQKDKEDLARMKPMPAPPQEPREAGWEAERLRDRLAAAQRELQAQKTDQQELQETNSRLKDKITRLEARLLSSTSQSSEAELVLEEEVRGLRGQLEEARRGVARLGQEKEEISRRLEERDREREALRRGKNELEEQKRLLDRALEKISKEMDQLSTESRQAVQGLQGQLEEYRERSRRELQDAQRQGKDRLGELQRAQATLRSLQEEVSRLKKELLLCSEQRDSAQLEKDLLSNRLKHTEEELQSERGSHSDRSREIRALEDQVKQLEMDLDEEKTNSELLADRSTRSRDQVDQLRSELMQERASRQDVELDKSVLERQLKEMRSRVADLEGQSRPSPGLEKSSMQSAHRRLERKLKELNITLEEERQRHSEQSDQVLLYPQLHSFYIHMCPCTHACTYISTFCKYTAGPGSNYIYRVYILTNLALRVKALKRQVDDREGEVERLEGLRRKAIREGEEHLEQKEALQARVSALEAELKRRVQQARRPLLSSEDDEVLDDTSSIASLLSERHLQPSAC
ncbi:hypothetical protein JZ751_000143 [Albula glossodonta]|uniref:Cingulin n=1 Tax=Albula glossodonta TaxID=121402 RepID=A0A8T2PVE9_9TELE|nr:hypothetical protein JZ751_000143 [Albula glossodonta]